MQETKPTSGAIAVTLLILVACVTTILLFAVPTTSPWFWPVAATLAGSIGLAMLIPLKPRS